MDAKLLKEFEEMEGLSNEVAIDTEGQIDVTEESEVKAANAQSLTSGDVFYEVSHSISVEKCSSLILPALTHHISIADGETWSGNDWFPRQ
jgi:hypothetical protein